MSRIYSSLTQLIGDTPLLEVKKIEKVKGLHARLLCKLEAWNPGGSAKDRPAIAMIEKAAEAGVLPPGGTIIEPTSGNTGIGLAWIAATRGYRVILTMPETMSVERRRLLAALGAEIVLTPGSEGMAGAIARANELHASIRGSFIPSQFSNPANPHSHETSTAEEIWRDTDGTVDILVAGVGTGGTLCGTARRLKEYNPKLRAVAVEPAASPVLEGGKPGPHTLQGIGAGFIPENYDASVVDDVIAVTGDEAVAAARLLVKEEGLLVGFSGGAAFDAAMRLAADPLNEGLTIVTVIPDTGERYLSTDLFANA